MYKKSNSHSAFTLAEVLITLGIIGVVAVMTMPALIQNYKKAETSSRLKKFYSTMEQAIKLSELDNNEATTWTKPESANVEKDFFFKYIAPYMKNTNYNEKLKRVYLADGSSFSIWNGECIDIVYDTNGDKRPNEAGRDRFYFVINLTDNYRKANCGNENKVFCTNVIVYSSYNHIFSSRQNALNGCKNSPVLCSSLLMLDGWEIKKDYPHKL